MKVLTIFAHHGSQSFCHAVLDRFDAGLREAGHTNEIVDLHAIKFDPVLRDRDAPNWMDADAPDEVLARMHLGAAIDEFGFRYPGIKRVQHEYFYAVHGGDSVRLRGYLDRAYQLGREF